MPEINPYAAPAAEIHDVETDLEAILAERGQRLGASIVDGLTLMPAAGLNLLLTKKFGGASPSWLLPAGIIGGVLLLVVWGFNLYFLKRDGQTLGKKAVGIRIVRSDGSRATLARLVFARALPVWIINFIPLVNMLVLVDVLFIFGKQRRCIHDHIADTIVVKV